MNNQRFIEETIFSKKTKQDKLGREYLILELDNKETIFVFSSKVKNDKWHDLEEGKKYKFKVEEGNTGSDLLTEFTILEDGFFVY